jgi:hypothetical protein
MHVMCISFCSNLLYSQSIIALQNFENAGSNFTYTNTNGFLQSGNSSSSDRAANASFYVSQNTGFRVTNQTAILDFQNISGLKKYHSKKITLRLAGFSINSTSNGLDVADKVKISVSLDGGTVFSDEMVVRGFSNAWWHYTTGTAVAEWTLDGNNVPVEFGPSGGGNRTVDGYSTMVLHLLDSCAMMKLKLVINNDSNNEAWLIDDVKLSGCLSEVLSCGEDTTVCLYQGLVALTGGSPAGGVYSGKGVTGNFFDPILAGTGVHTIKYLYQYDCGSIDSCYYKISVIQTAMTNLRTAKVYCSLQEALELKEIQDGDILKLFSGDYLGSRLAVKSNLTFKLQSQPVIIQSLQMDEQNKQLELEGDLQIQKLKLSRGTIRLKGSNLRCEQITGSGMDSYIITD